MINLEENCNIEITVSPFGTKKIYRINKVLLSENNSVDGSESAVQQCLEHMVYDLMCVLRTRLKKEG